MDLVVYLETKREPTVDHVGILKSSAYTSIILFTNKLFIFIDRTIKAYHVVITK